MGKIATSWELVKKSLAILASDKELVLLPLTSAFLSLLAGVLLFGTYFVTNWPEIRAAHAAGPGARLPYTGTLYLLTFVFYVANYFVVVFCNVALVAVANNRMGGGSWGMRAGLDLAWQRKWSIFQWAVFAATVGMILRTISERVGLLGRIVVGLVGLAWSLAIYFIVPVLAFENLGPIDAFKRSVQLFRKTWGERVVAGVSFGLIFALPWFLLMGLAMALMPMMAGSIVALIAVYGFLTVSFVVLFAVSSAASSIFNVALYNYALSGRVHGGFSEDDFLFAWVPKN